MSLKGVLARLHDGPSIQLVKGEEVIEMLPIIKATRMHRSFILATWVKSLTGRARSMGVTQEMFTEGEPPIAESYWDNCWVVTDDDGFTVHAWVCGNKGDLMHVYVVPELRRLRIATRLIELATGGLKAYARPWPYTAHAPVNPYLLKPMEKK